MNTEVRLIDANALIFNRHQVVNAAGDAVGVRRYVTFEEIADEPTIEAVTREQYHEMTERFIDEFVDNGANEVTVANCMLIGLAFGKLELMLFGENEEADK